MKEFFVCMEACHQIYNTCLRSMLYKDLRMFLIQDYFVICCGPILMTYKDGETMIEVFHSFLGKTLLKSFVKNMTWISLLEAIRL